MPANMTTVSAERKADKAIQQRTALNLKRSYLILNLTDMNDLPAMDRWLFKEHAIDTVSVNGSILSGYATYRALPIPRGGSTTVNDGPFFRFVIAMKYPEGVSQAEGERWFYDSFIPAMKNQNDLLRGFSYKGIEPHVTPFTRIVELWYCDSNAWIRNWGDGKPNIKAPTWATYNQNGIYLEPYKDMVCIFLEESPERDFLKQGTAYYTDN